MLHQPLKSIHKRGGGYVHSSINDSRRPIPKNGPIHLDRCRRLVDDVFEHGVGSVELRYPGCELYHIPYISLIRR